MRNFLLVLFCTLSFLACKEKPGTKVKKSNTPKTERAKADKTAYNESETGFRAEARTIIARRTKENPKPPAVIEADLWEYVFVYEDGKMSEEGAKAGEWIDFKIDGSYEYGKYDKTTGSGTYHHHFDSQMIILLDDEENVIPKEFQTKFGGDVLILVGRPMFGNNGTQMKLQRINKKPVK